MRQLVRAGRLLRFTVDNVNHAIAVEYPIERTEIFIPSGASGEWGRRGYCHCPLEAFHGEGCVYRDRRAS